MQLLLYYLMNRTETTFLDMIHCVGYAVWFDFGGLGQFSSYSFTVDFTAILISVFLEYSPPPVRVQKENLYLHPDLEYWVYCVAKNDHPNKFVHLGHFVLM